MGLFDLLVKLNLVYLCTVKSLGPDSIPPRVLEDEFLLFSESLSPQLLTHLAFMGYNRRQANRWLRNRK